MSDLPITQRRIGPLRVLDIGTVVVILAVLGTIALVADLRQSDTGADADPAQLGRAATKVADAQVLGLTTLDRKDIEAKLAALKARVSDDYAAGFAAQLATFTQEALDYDGLATGEITSSTVEDVDDEQAQVAVTSTTRVTKRQTPTLERTYAFTVTLVREGDEWLVSDLQLTAG